MVFKRLIMPAYIIVDITIHNSENYEEYKKLTPPSLLPYEGKFIARGGATETLEGDWRPGRMVILEFPSFEKAMQWWNSEEYSPAKALRQANAETKMIVVEGVGG